MLSWTAVLVGGSVGSGLRYAMALALPAQGAAGFPIGTLTVNLLGCLLIGVGAALLGPSSAIAPHLRLGVMVGLLGPLQRRWRQRCRQGLPHPLGSLVHIHHLLSRAWTGVLGRLRRVE